MEGQDLHPCGIMWGLQTEDNTSLQRMKRLKGMARSLVRRSQRPEPDSKDT